MDNPVRRLAGLVPIVIPHPNRPPSSFQVHPFFGAVEKSCKNRPREQEELESSLQTEVLRGDAGSMSCGKVGENSREPERDAASAAS